MTEPPRKRARLSPPADIQTETEDVILIQMEPVIPEIDVLAHSIGSDKRAAVQTPIGPIYPCERERCRGDRTVNPACWHALGLGTRGIWRDGTPLAVFAQNVIANWEKPPQATPGFVNLANTCYMNSILQLLAVAFPFVSQLVSSYSEMCEHAIAGHESAIPACELTIILLEVYMSDLRSIDPSNLADLLKLDVDEQQDAVEFLILLFGMLEPLTTATSTFVSISQNHTRCASCGKLSDASNRNQISYAVSVPLKHNLSMSFGELFQVEELDASVKYKCAECRAVGGASRSMKLVQSGDVFLIHMNCVAFDQSAGQLIRHNGKVVVPIQLQIHEKHYRLVGYLQHCGEADYGHYTCDILDGIVVNNETSITHFSDDEIDHRTKKVKPSPSWDHVDGFVFGDNAISVQNPHCLMYVLNDHTASFEVPIELSNTLKKRLAEPMRRLSLWKKLLDSYEKEVPIRRKLGEELQTQLRGNVEPWGQGLWISQNWFEQIVTGIDTNVIQLSYHDSIPEPNCDSFIFSEPHHLETCPHGLLSVPDCFRIRKAAARVLLRIAPGSEFFTDDQVCEICKSERAEREIFLSQLADLKENIKGQMVGKRDFVLNRYYYKQLRAGNFEQLEASTDMAVGCMCPHGNALRTKETIRVPLRILKAIRRLFPKTRLISAVVKCEECVKEAPQVARASVARKKQKKSLITLHDCLYTIDRPVSLQVGMGLIGGDLLDCLHERMVGEEGPISKNLDIRCPHGKLPFYPAFISNIARSRILLRRDLEVVKPIRELPALRQILTDTDICIPTCTSLTKEGTPIFDIETCSECAKAGFSNEERSNLTQIEILILPLFRRHHPRLIQAFQTQWRSIEQYSNFYGMATTIDQTQRRNIHIDGFIITVPQTWTISMLLDHVASQMHRSNLDRSSYHHLHWSEDESISFQQESVRDQSLSAAGIMHLDAVILCDLQSGVDYSSDRNRSAAESPQQPQRSFEGSLLSKPT